MEKAGRKVAVDSMNTEIVSQLQNIKCLDKALRYLETKDFSLAQMELVAQDEFSLDIILPIPKEQTFLTLGVT